MKENLLSELLKKARKIKGWPKTGVTFFDLNPVISDAYSFNQIIHQLCEFSQYKNLKIAGIEARGFIWGAAVASKLCVPFIPIRKADNLPPETVQEATFTMSEYSQGMIALPKGCVTKGDNVVLIDDVLATGQTALGAINLLRWAGAEICAANFVLEIKKLSGFKTIPEVLINVVASV